MDERWNDSWKLTFHLKGLDQLFSKEKKQNKVYLDGEI